MKKFTQDYLDILNGELKGLNLTRILDFDDFYNKQIVDSIKPFEISNVFSNSIKSKKRLIDVGFGGGFPILPLAKLLPEIDFLGLEARAKKSKAVMLIAERLSIKNVQTMHKRVEDFIIDYPSVITFKAVSNIFNCLNRLKHTKELDVFFYKGPNVHSLENEDMKIALDHWKLIEELEYTLPSGEKRWFVGYRSKRSSNVPRGTK